MVSDDPARTGVKSEGQIKPSFGGFDVGDVALPELARPISFPAASLADGSTQSNLSLSNPQRSATKSSKPFTFWGWPTKFLGHRTRFFLFGLPPRWQRCANVKAVGAWVLKEYPFPLDPL